MKAYQTYNGIDWVEILPYEFTKEELEILYDPSDKDYQSTIDSIISEKTSTISDTSFLITIMEDNLPTIPEGSSFNLLSVDIVDEDNIISGLINYRLDNDHLQIRFIDSK